MNFFIVDFFVKNCRDLSRAQKVIFNEVPIVPQNYEQVSQDICQTPAPIHGFRKPLKNVKSETKVDSKFYYIEL